MTRINSNLDPSILLDQHLMAEYRELPMVFGSLKRSLKTRSVKDILSGIPNKFTLNSGHVSFFYDKLRFLERRYDKLVLQLKCRGYSLDSERNRYNLEDFPTEFHNDWDSTPEDDLVVITRIKEKFYMKPDWYRYFGDPIDPIVFEVFYNEVLYKQR